jgi:cbb3-type cytochrome oxidase subunit 3
MKLSDIMSAAGLSLYAEAALLIFIGVFLAVALDVFRSSRRHEEASLLPLEDDSSARPRERLS